MLLNYTPLMTLLVIQGDCDDWPSHICSRPHQPGGDPRNTVIYQQAYELFSSNRPIVRPLQQAGSVDSERKEAFTYGFTSLSCYLLTELVNV
jgi:hypothetical protein